jgi:hypothetical protein
MSDPITSPPTLAGFIAWTRAVMGIPTTAIPDNDPGYAYAFQIALDVVPLDFSAYSPDIYTITVYNWGGSNLLQFQQDIPGQTFFKDARAAYNMSGFVAGVINSASDVSTSEALSVGQGLQNLTLLDLQAIKDPYGRQALAYMQTLGTLWGLT